VRGSQGKTVTVGQYCARCDGTQKQESLQHLFAHSDGMCKADQKCHIHVLSLVGFNPQPVAARESVQVSAEVSGRAVGGHLRPWGNRVLSSQVECFQGNSLKSTAAVAWRAVRHHWVRYKTFCHAK
jgi:hypothetical protein